MTEVHWVIGAGGLLGSSVKRELVRRGAPVLDGPRIDWRQPARSLQLAEALERLLASAARDQWTIYWCAGAATTSSSPEALATEVATIRDFLTRMRGYPQEKLARGAIFFASSAGAIYGGANGAPFTESHPATPLGDYGSAKVHAEQCFRSLATESPVCAVVGRIANLYGPGQSLAKPQGLVSRLCLASVTRTPLSVFVSMDTIRDYLYVDDCASLVVDAMRRAHQRTDSRYHVKVLASGRPVSIIELLHQFRLVAKSRPYLVLGQSREAALQSRDLRLKSTYWPDLDGRPKVGLLDGIARTMEDVRAAHARALVR